MRKDIKIVVAAACFLLVGLLAYVLFAPGQKKAELVDETTTEAGGETNVTPAVESQQQPSVPAVNVTLAPTTEPTSTVSVAVVSATQPSVAIGVPVAPAVDSNVAVGTTSAVSTDWDKTLNTGAVATATGTHAALPGNTLIGATNAPLGASSIRFSSSDPATKFSTPDVTASASDARKHKVVYGETLSSIASQYYGTKANYTKILAANPGLNANHLKVGTVLTIPALANSKPVATAATAERASAASGTTYAVKPGDSLQKIATKLYGSSDKWQKIYEMNRSAIGGDPHRLRAGMVLKLPDAR